MTTNSRFDETAFQWQNLDKAAQRFKLTLRPILQGVEFAASAADDPLIEATRFVKEAFRSGKSLGEYSEDALLMRWVLGEMKRYLYDGGNKDNAERLLPDRYEFLLYHNCVSLCEK